MAKSNEKKTAQEIYNIIKTAMADNEEVVAFCDKKIEQLIQKCQKEADRRAEKRANKEPDEMAIAILDALDGAEDYMSADDIIALIDNRFEDVTKAKIAARLRKPVADGNVIKEVATIDKKKVTRYKLV